MEQTLRLIENEISDERRDLSRHLEELEQQARSLADWRTHYRRHTAASLGLAASAGLVLGALTAGARSVSASTSTAQSRSRLAEIDRHGRVGQRTSETWDRILDALLGVASAAAVGFVGSYVPGFREEYEFRNRGRS